MFPSLAGGCALAVSMNLFSDFKFGRFVSLYNPWTEPMFYVMFKKRAGVFYRV